MLMTLMHDSNLKNSLTSWKIFQINRTNKLNLQQKMKKKKKCLDFLDQKSKIAKGDMNLMFIANKF